MLTIPGAPDHELVQTSAARRIAELAARSGPLGMAHFEHRVQLETPAAWLPEGRPDLGEPSGWVAGQKPERKFQSFRHDLIIGSFHPGHRAKWTAHELCHALVGFAWAPGAPPLFHALAARLAEVLPVALYYFFDEIDLARCPEHVGQGPLFNHYCAACKRAAAAGPTAPGPDAAARRSEGLAFVEGELAATRRALRLGRPVCHRWATLELMSDGLAYAAAHGARLTSPEMARFVEGFFPDRTGWCPSLEALAARVEALTAHAVGQGEATPLAGGPWRPVVQDVAWRLLQVRSETEGDARDGLDALVDALAAAPDEAGLLAAIAGYEALHADFVLPAPADLFAVGYPLPGGAYGRSTRQIAEGLKTACPDALSALGAEREAAIADFVAHDEAARVPLGRRFAAYLASHRPGSHEAAVAGFEAAIVHARPRDPGELTLGWAGVDTEIPVRLAAGAEVVEAPAGAVGAAAQPVVVLREVDGRVSLVPVPPEAAARLSAVGQGGAPLAALALADEVAGLLVDAGALVPLRWPVRPR